MIARIDMIARIEKNRPENRLSVRHPAATPTTGVPVAGFTLIEVLLALAIFSIGLLAVASMQISSVTKNTSSRLNTMAVEYASDYMERLLGLGMDSDIIGNGMDDDLDGTIDDDDEVLGYPHLIATDPDADRFIRRAGAIRRAARTGNPPPHRHRRGHHPRRHHHHQ